MSRVLFSQTPPSALFSRLGKAWAPTLAIWGIGAGTAAVFLLSVTPIVKNGLLVKLPLIGSVYEDKTPASDKPF
ncbi:cytochrome b-c1 complex subunit 10 [Thelephora terrestris]|uniref:Cytochrome b-c1 complex subunit 10 n=1 Tax=Thelephora terrestris TaxID=56493 RepID=A0A9P6HPY5_9AGAM|nr:cytochrome b-c1 complex subunit 10 [Thelephora terrestris]